MQLKCFSSSHQIESLKYFLVTVTIWKFSVLERTMFDICGEQNKERLTWSINKTNLHWLLRWPYRLLSRSSLLLRSSLRSRSRSFSLSRVESRSLLRVSLFSFSRSTSRLWRLRSSSLSLSSQEHSPPLHEHEQLEWLHKFTLTAHYATCSWWLLHSTKLTSISLIINALTDNHTMWCSLLFTKMDSKRSRTGIFGTSSCFPKLCCSPKGLAITGKIRSLTLMNILIRSLLEFLWLTMQGQLYALLF